MNWLSDPGRDQRSADPPHDLCDCGEVAPDLKTCRAYISVLGDEEAKRNTLQGLKNAEGYIRRQLAKTINLRNTPEIRFILDESIEYGVAMSKLIDEVSKKEDAQEVQEDGEDNQ